MKENFNILGFDIGGTKVAVTLATSNGKILASERMSSKDISPNIVLPELVKIGKNLLKSANIAISDLRTIGIGAPAPHDVEKGIIIAPGNMPLWRNVAIKDYMANAFGVDTYFENDANAGALAEWFFGAGRGCKNMIYLTMSTGIGGGLICNGHLVQGGSLQGGEAGHFVLDPNGPECGCGLKGCYEAFCGGRTIAKRLQKELANKPNCAIVKEVKGDLDKIDLRVLENAVRANDEFAVKFWDDMMLRNAQAIGGFINLFNPDRIVLGTLAWATGDLFMKPLKKYLPRFSWSRIAKNCEITVSALGREIGEYSSISVALNNLYEQGEWELTK